MRSGIINTSPKDAKLELKLADAERRLMIAEIQESKDLLDLAKLVADMRSAQIENEQTGRFDIREEMRRRQKKVDNGIKSIFNNESSRRDEKESAMLNNP